MATLKKQDDEEKLIIYWRLPEWFKDLSPDAMKKLHAFHGELIKFNRAINLISVATVSQADLIHVADSVIAMQQFIKGTKHKEVYDIGAGNGFPGIVLSILAPDRKVIVVDRDTRKIEFLKHCASTLGLKNLEAQCKRIEDIPDNAINCGISRGFASISKAILATRKQFKKDGEYFHMKGDIWGREFAEIPSQLFSVWNPALFAQYELPVRGEKMALVVTKKIG